MNVFELFKTKDIEDVKLGLQVVKSLGLQNEFVKEFGLTPKYFNKSLKISKLISKQMRYNKIYQQHIFYSLVNLDAISQSLLNEMANKNFKLTNRYFDVTKLMPHSTFRLIIKDVKVSKYFNLKLFDSFYSYNLLYKYPKLVKKTNLDVLNKYQINNLIINHPQLKRSLPYNKEVLKFYNDVFTKTYNLYVTNNLIGFAKLCDVLYRKDTENAYFLNRSVREIQHFQLHYKDRLNTIVDFISIVHKYFGLKELYY